MGTNTWWFFAHRMGSGGGGEVAPNLPETAWVLPRLPSPPTTPHFLDLFLGSLGRTSNKYAWWQLQDHKISCRAQQGLTPPPIGSQLYCCHPIAISGTMSLWYRWPTYRGRGQGMGRRAATAHVSWLSVCGLLRLCVALWPAPFSFNGMYTISVKENNKLSHRHCQEDSTKHLR